MRCCMKSDAPMMAQFTAINGRKIAPYGSYIRSVYGVGYIFEGEKNETAEA